MIFDWKGIILSLILFIILFCYLMLKRPKSLYEKIICFLASCLPRRNEDRQKEWLAIFDELQTDSERIYFLASLMCVTFVLLPQSLQPKRLFSIISTNVLHYCDRLYLGKSTPQHIQDDSEAIDREYYK